MHEDAKEGYEGARQALYENNLKRMGYEASRLYRGLRLGGSLDAGEQDRLDGLVRRLLDGSGENRP